MQNGRPTRVEANSKRPEHVWREVWDSMPDKRREEEKATWDILKPIVQECRQERNLPPIQKHDNVFWETWKKAKELRTAPAAPAMPLIEKCENEDLSLQAQHFGPYHEAVELLEARIKELEATLARHGRGQRLADAEVDRSAAKAKDVVLKRHADVQRRRVVGERALERILRG